MAHQLTTRPDATRFDAAAPVTFGGLKLTFTDIFDYRWTDAGSGGDYDVGFYAPRMPEGLTGFRALGSIGIQGYEGPNNRYWALCVAADDADPTAVREPDGYDWVWSDAGSGADADGSCWRPRPPQGYVALGDVFVTGHGEPDRGDVWCVREDLVGEADVAEWIWDDAGTGSDLDFSAWGVSPKPDFVSETQILVAPNTFRGVASHDRPAVRVRVLKLVPPTVSATNPPVPTLPSRERPPAQSTEVWDRKVTLPFTAVHDEEFRDQLHRQIEESPFYVLERWQNFELTLFDDNQQAEPHTIETTVTVGVSEQSTQTFSHEVGITVSYESGIKAGPVSTKVSGSLSYKFGYSSATQIGSFRNSEIKTHLTTPGKHAAAQWTPRTAFKLFRTNGSQVGGSLVLDDAGTAFYEREFPATPGRKPLRRR